MLEPHGQGGIAQYTLLLARALCDRRIAVHVATSQDYELRHFVPQSLQTIACLHPLVNSLRRTSGIAFRILRIADLAPDCFKVLHLCRALKPDIVHLQSALPFDALLLCTFPHLPVVATVHNILPHRPRPFDLALCRWLYRRASALIFHGEANKREFARRFRSQAVMRVIPMGCFDVLARGAKPSRQEARRKLGIEAEAAVVLFFGQIRPNKGLEVLLRAFPQVLRAVPSARILAAGFPLAGMREVTSLVEELGLRPFTYLLPRYIPLEEVEVFFQAADVVAMPYLSVTQSAVLPAAMAFGKAVVASSVGALPEVVKDGDTGLLVPPGQPGPLAEAIIRLLTDERLREETGRNLKEAGQTIFTWPRAAEATEALYREVLARR